MRLKGLRPMGIGELAVRSRQEASKWLERVGRLGRPAPAAFDADALLARFRADAPSRFFAGATSEASAHLVARTWPAARDEIVRAAEAVCSGRFDLLGYRGLRIGDPIDWHRDPVSGRRAPFVHWSRIDPLDAAAVGDSKVVWELNRHQWLVTLGLAYRSTGEQRFLEAFGRHVRDWIAANPRGLGINWASSLEVALRIVSWCWALALFSSSPALTAPLFAEIRASLCAHADHVDTYLSHCFSPNTHLTGEALGLFYAATLFPGLPAAARWRVRGERILVEQLRRQVLPDGVYFEQSTCYQRYTIDIYLHLLILARRNGLAMPREIPERLQALLDSLLVLRQPNGHAPPIGDADGGWLLPLAIREPGDVRGVFATAAALFGRSEYAWAAGGSAPETIWLLGSEGLRAYERVRPAPPEEPPSRLLPDGGYAVMASGWGPKAHHLIFDVGPLGCPVSGGHGHADLLSIQCCAFGEPFLVDPGTYVYTPDPEWRDFFRGAAAHSTVEVDGARLAVPAGPFAWGARPRGRMRRWVSLPTFDLADGEHEAYRRLRRPVLHRRRIVFLKPRCWVVADDLVGDGEHGLEVRFQFAPLSVALEQAGWVRARGRRSGLLLRSFARVPLEVSLHSGESDPIQGWVSPDYGLRRPAPVLVCATTAPLPLRILTLVLPLADPAAEPPAVSVLAGERGEVRGLAFDEEGESVAFDDDEVSLTLR